MLAPQHCTCHGVFAPLGHVVVSFPTDTELDAAMRSLAGLGFPAELLGHYEPAEMLAQAESDLAQVSPIAAFGSAYTAQAGDTYWSIAVALVSGDEAPAYVHRLIQVNGPEALRAGRVISIPEP